MKPKQIAETGWRYLRAFLILYLCLFAGNIIAVLLPFSVPAASWACCCFLCCSHCRLFRRTGFSPAVPY